MNPKVSGLSQMLRERLAFLEFRAFSTGELRQGDIEAGFGIKPKAAARDLTVYRKMAPPNLQYDSAPRCSRPSSAFSPLFDIQPDCVGWLLDGFFGGLEFELRQAVAYEGPGSHVPPVIPAFAALTSAMCAKRAIFGRHVQFPIKSRPDRFRHGEC